MKTGTIKVSVLYPSGKDTTFDMEYYVGKHIPLVLALLGDDVKLGAIEKGIHGDTPNDPAPYLVMAHLYFDTLEIFHRIFPLNEAEIMKDMPNYTNITPIVQVSEVVV